MSPRLANRRALSVFLAVALALIGVSKILPSSAAADGSATYTYDALGRVTSVTYDTGVVVNYTYDANGNRTAQTINVATGLIWQPTPPVMPCTANCWDSSVWN